MADAIQREQGETGGAQRTLIALGLAVFCTMNVSVFTMALWSRAVYGPADTAMNHAWEELLRWGGFCFSIPVLALLGGPLVRTASEGLLRGQIVVDQLLLVGVVVAFAYSMVSLFRGNGDVYFEVGCVILLAVTIGRWLEAIGRQRAMSAIDALEQLLPATVRRRFGGSGGGDREEEVVPLSALRPGDVIRVLGGERISADGIVLSPAAVVDEQFLSGESLPQEKSTGDRIHAGALNLGGELLLRVLAVAEEGSLRRIADLVRQAAFGKGPHQRLADGLTACFVPAVFFVALLTYICHSATRPFAEAWMAALSVVLIACPCALAIATPLAMWSALSHAACRGVVVRSGETLERLARAKRIFFDKTGTLTTGLPRLVEIETTSALEGATSVDDVRQRGIAMARRSNHPLCRAILEGTSGVLRWRSLPRVDTGFRVTGGDSSGGMILGGDPMPVPPNGPLTELDAGTIDTGFRVTGGDSSGGTILGGDPMPVPPNGPLAELDAGVAVEVPGRGVRWMHPHDGVMYLGSPAFAHEVGGETPVDLAESLDAATRVGLGRVLLGWGGWTRAVFWFSEHARSEVGEVLQALRAQGLAAELLTGDRHARAVHMFGDTDLGIRADCSPRDKLDSIEQARGESGPVVMVGDGINDAPALAAADVGIAMGLGADVARSAAEICLMRDDLRLIPWTIDIARRARNTVRRNLVWAFAYNIIGMWIAAMGWLNPIVAAMAMVGSSLLVIAESLRLAPPRQIWAPSADSGSDAPEAGVASSVHGVPT